VSDWAAGRSSVPATGGWLPCRRSMLGPSGDPRSLNHYMPRCGGGYATTPVVDGRPCCRPRLSDAPPRRVCELLAQRSLFGWAAARVRDRKQAIRLGRLDYRSPPPYRRRDCGGGRRHSVGASRHRRDAPTLLAPLSRRPGRSRPARAATDAGRGPVPAGCSTAWRCAPAGPPPRGADPGCGGDRSPAGPRSPGSVARGAAAGTGRVRACPLVEDGSGEADQPGIARACHGFRRRRTVGP
jgi:hypothetical protein